MTTIRGTVTKREARTVDAGPEVLMTVQPPQGPSIPVVWRGPGSFGVGELVEASGERDSDGYLMAASVNKVEAAKPLPQKRKLYVLRAIGGSFLGDLLAFLAAVVLFRNSKDSLLVWTVLFLFGALFSAGLTALFARTDRKPNAILGAALAVGIPLALVLLYKVLH
jgi:hypothetical protein